MNLYPRIYLDRITEISIEFLRANQLNALILDVDNTLIDYDKVLPKDIEKWCKDLKSKGIKMFILSNTNKIEKVKKVANILELEFINFAHKPNKKGFLKVKERLGLKEENIAVVGDQIFTDILGGNRVNMFTILTKPIDTRDIIITKIKRPFEKIVLKSYLKRKGA